MFTLKAEERAKVLRFTSGVRLFARLKSAFRSCYLKVVVLKRYVGLVVVVGIYTCILKHTLQVQARSRGGGGGVHI